MNRGDPSTNVTIRKRNLFLLVLASLCQHKRKESIFCQRTNKQMYPVRLRNTAPAYVLVLNYAHLTRVNALVLMLALILTSYVCVNQVQISDIT